MLIPVSMATNPEAHVNADTGWMEGRSIRTKEDSVNTTTLHGGSRNSTAYYFDIDGAIRIPLFTVIFLCGVVGNILVIITLARNRRLRIVTNVFLLNLALSDLLLGVFCMPFTLVGTLMREFIFGEAMCKIIPYLQGTSVAVNAWTLVAISMERYYAVCEPLKSRRWQTTSHAYKIVAGIWLMGLAMMSPLTVLSKLLPMEGTGKYKCREVWPSEFWEGAFSIILDCCLLFVPLVVMALAYYRICAILRKGIKESEKCAQTITIARTSAVGFYTHISTVQDCISRDPPRMVVKWTRPSSQSEGDGSTSESDKNITPAVVGGQLMVLKRYDSGIRSNNLEKRIAVKKRVIRMLFMVVLEFFICWTPIYVINTITCFSAEWVYSGLGYLGLSFFHLLSYVSFCCNPITYCFMNKNFRKEFINMFIRPCGQKEKVVMRRKLTDTSVNARVLRPLKAIRLEGDCIALRQL